MVSCIHQVRNTACAHPAPSCLFQIYQANPPDQQASSVELLQWAGSQSALPSFVAFRTNNEEAASSTIPSRGGSISATVDFIYHRNPASMFYVFSTCHRYSDAGRRTSQTQVASSACPLRCRAARKTDAFSRPLVAPSRLLHRLC